MAQEVKNSSYMVSNSHIALGSNLASLAHQAKTHNPCSNNLYTTKMRKTTATFCHCSNFCWRVKCI